jgi:hypothetical protein
MLKIHSSEYSFIFGGSVAMIFNEDVARQMKKILRQDDTLSTMLFNIVDDMLGIITEHAKSMLN